MLANSQTPTCRQAVVIADSFDKRFMPLTQQFPRCLIPLCNVPLIEYTLEFLAASGIQEVFIICNSHHALIKSYIESSKWCSPVSATRARVRISRSSRSVGDVLRELDTGGVIEGDFVIVSGDVVANLNLKPIIDAHLLAREKDKTRVMTMVLKRGAPFHRARACSGTFVLGAETGRCLQYIPPSLAESINVNYDVIARFMPALLRSDLIDCEVDICSPEVLALFSENFDYQEVRRDFVRGILESDLVEKSIYAHVIESEYAVRVRNTQLYDVVSMDVIARWAYPVVPESNFWGNSTYSACKDNVYRELKVSFSRKTDIGPSVIVGRNTTINEDTKVSFTVIGRNCRVSKNVKLNHAYLWDYCEIGENCSVEYSILSVNVVLKGGNVLPPGCILGKGVVLGLNVRLAPHTRLCLPLPGQQSDPSAVGADGVGRIWTASSRADGQAVLPQFFGHDIPDQLDSNTPLLQDNFSNSAFEPSVGSADSMEVHDGSTGSWAATAAAAVAEQARYARESADYYEAYPVERCNSQSPTGSCSKGTCHHRTILFENLQHDIGYSSEMLRQYYSESQYYSDCVSDESEDLNNLSEIEKNNEDSRLSDHSDADTHSRSTRHKGGKKDKKKKRKRSRTQSGSLSTRMPSVSPSNSSFSTSSDETVCLEIRATITRALEGGYAPENALIELNTLKFADNLGFDDLRIGVIPCVLDHCVAQNGAVAKTFETWVSVIAGLVPQLPEQAHALDLIIAWFEEHLEHLRFLPKFLSLCYMADALSDETIIQWYLDTNPHFEAKSKKRRPGSRTTTMLKILASCQEFVQWLIDNAGEDSNGSEEGSSEENQSEDEGGDREIEN